MKVTGKLFLTGGDSDLPVFTSASDEDRAKLVHYYAGSYDMSKYEQMNFNEVHDESMLIYNTDLKKIK